MFCVYINTIYGFVLFGYFILFKKYKLNENCKLTILIFNIYLLIFIYFFLAF